MKNTKKFIPLTAQQVQLLYEWQKNPDSAEFNVGMCIKVCNADIKRLRNVCTVLYKSIDAIYTSLERNEAGEPVQKIDFSGDYIFEDVDLSENSDSTQEERQTNARKIISEHMARPFKITDEYLNRTLFVKISDSEYWILHWANHLIADAGTVQALLNLITILYNKPWLFKCIALYSKLFRLPLPTTESFNRHFSLNTSVLKKASQYWSERLNKAQFSVDLRLSVPDIHSSSRLDANEQSIITKEIEFSAEESVTGQGLLEYSSHHKPKSGGRLSIPLSSSISQKISERNFSANGQRISTTFTTLTTLFQILLTKYTGQEEVTIKYPVDIRPKIGGVRGKMMKYFMIGYYVNSLPLRTTILGKNRIIDILNQNFKNLRLDQKYRHIPFSRLIQDIRKVTNDFDSGHQVTVASTLLSNLPVPIKNTESSLNIEFRGTIQNSLALLIDQSTPSSLMIALEYDRNLYDESTILGFAKRFIRLLEVTLIDFDQLVSNIDIRSRREIATDNELLFYTQSKDHDQLTTHLENAVLKFSNKTALICNDQQFTFNELNQRSNQLANFLVQQYSCEQLNFIAIYLERSVDFVISILASIKLGAAYIPIDTYQPKDRVTTILTDLAKKSSPILLTNSELAKDLTVECEYVNLNITNSQISQMPGSKAVLKKKVDPLLYIIYTSGSTGEPKGVKVDQVGVVSRLKWFIDKLGLTESDIYLHRSSFTFDPSVRELLVPLITGGTVILADQYSYKDPRMLAKLCSEHGVTVASFVPELLKAFLETANNITCPNLTKVTCGADVLEKDVVDKFFTKFSSARLLNLYGPTETSIFCLFHEVSKKPYRQKIPIGAPVDDVQAHILDRDLKPVPDGLCGELCISGLGISRGYLNKAELSNQAFLELPLTPQGGTRCYYKTGDLVRRVQGQIDFLGRIDNQVKIRGYRIELSEIELKIEQLSFIKNSAAIVAEQSGKKKAIFAFYVLDKTTIENESIGPASECKFLNIIYDYLSDELPEYMLPKQMVRLETIPLNFNGKLNQRKLEQLIPSYESVEGRVLPYTPFQETIHSIWTSVLGLEENDLGVRDNFFDVGGDSLSLINLQNALCAEFKEEISLQQLFENPFVESMASIVENQLSQPNALNQSTLSPKRTEYVIADSNWSPKTEYEEIEFASKNNSSCNNILLTGGNGFLGIHLLNELTEKFQDHRIYCLIRSSTIADAKRKLNAGLEKFGFESLVEHSRIHVILGDLSKDRLGLDDKTLEFLENEISDIYHNGALVHHLHPYQSLRNANVISTQFLILLALRKCRKNFHFVSTRGVVTHQEHAVDSVTQGPFQELPNSNNGYVLSKWVCEKMIWNAFIHQGLPAKIYRPGLLAGHSKTGRLNPDNYHMALFFKGTWQLQHFPKDIALEMTPVDIVAKAIVSLSRRSKEYTEIFNLQNPVCCTQEDYFDVIREFNKQIAPVDLLKFREMVAQLTENNAYYIYKDRFLEHTDGKTAIGEELVCETHYRETQKAISDEGIKYPTDHKGILRSMFLYWLETGFINRE